MKETENRPNSEFETWYTNARKNHTHYYSGEWGRDLSTMNEIDFQNMLGSIKEAEQIRIIFPTEKTTRDVRIIKNREIREKLSTASNYAVIYLAIDCNRDGKDQISQQELSKRLNDDEINFNELFAILQRNYHITRTKYTTKLSKETLDRAEEKWQTSTIEQKQEIYDIYGIQGTYIIANRTTFFDDVGLSGLQSRKEWNYAYLF